MNKRHLMMVNNHINMIKYNQGGQHTLENNLPHLVKMRYFFRRFLFNRTNLR